MSADAKRPEVDEQGGAAERPPDEPPSDLWAVSYDENDDRELTTSQIANALARKEIDGTTLVWHPGMLEWQPLQGVDELATLLDTTVSISDDSVGEPSVEKPKSLPPAPLKPQSDPPPASPPATADEKPKKEKPAAAQKQTSARQEKKRDSSPRPAPTRESSSKLALVVLACVGVAIVLWLTRREPVLPNKAAAELATPAPVPTPRVESSASTVPPSPAPVASDPLPPVSLAPSGEGFDKIGARKILARDEFHASRCRLRAEPPGTAQVNVTFEPSGRVSDARIIQKPYAATLTGTCIESKLKNTRVPPFQGDPVTLRVPVILY